MKRHIRLFLLLIGCCLIHSLLFGQDKVFSIKFAGFKTRFSKQAKAILDNAAKTIKNQPNSYFAITSCTGGENEGLNQTIWDRINKIVTHLEKKGINADRLVFAYDGIKDDCNTIYLTFREGIPENPSSFPPHPNLRNKN